MTGSPWNQDRPIAPSWKLKLGVRRVVELKKMPKSLARHWLRMQTDANLTDEERESALEVTKPDGIRQSTFGYDPHEQKFRAVAYLLGASYGQLALRAGHISRATVVESVRRQLKEDYFRRDELRSKEKLTFTQLDEVHDRFMILAEGSPSTFDATSAVQLAQMLGTMPADMEIEAGDTDDVPDRRIEGEDESLLQPRKSDPSDPSQSLPS